MRVDVRLACKPGTSPTGNLQGQLSAARVVAPLADTINSGAQTIPFLKVGEIEGAGEPLLRVHKSVTSAGGTCGVDDGELRQMTAGGSVKYCYVVTNPGTFPLYDVSAFDDNATPDNPADDFTVTLTGLQVLDSQKDAGDLGAGTTARGEYTVGISSGGTFVNTVVVTGNNGKTGGNFAVLSDSDTATVEAIGTPNRPPIAQDDAAATREDVAVVIAPLGNDSDPDGNLDLDSLALLMPPLHGTLIAAADGTFRYVPAPEFNGIDSFTYQVCDGFGLCDSATVNLTVQAVNDPAVAADDTATTPEDTSVAIAVLSNDSAGPSGEPQALAIRELSDPPHGTVTRHDDGTLTYTPNPEFSGTDAFTYLACDSGGSCASATVIILVTRVNDAPVATADSASGLEDAPLTFAPLANDFDPDGTLPPGSVILATQPQSGSVTVNADGTLTYTPAADFSGTDSFSYQICDAEGLCATATVTLAIAPVNDAPVALPDAGAGEEDMPITVAVTSNDSDVDGNLDPLTAVAITDPANGTLVNNGDGSFTYVPNANFFGTDTFVYEVCDTDGACATSEVSFFVAAVNDPPVAGDDGATLPEDGAAVIAVLGNDGDLDGNLDPASLSIVSGPAHGTVTVNPDGTITYTPAANYHGADSVTYQVCDRDGLCATATVYLQVTPVNDPPVATDDAATLPEDTRIALIVAANDSDVDGDLDLASAEVLSGPAHGTVTDNGDGTFTYVPAPNYSGSDSFSYQLCDTSGACDTATVALTVLPVNDPPYAGADAYQTLEDTTLTIAASAGILGNDGDVDGDKLTLSLLSKPAHGTLTVAADGSFAYVPSANYNGPDQFSYQVCDAAGLCASTTVSLTVVPVNDTPIAVNDAYKTGQGQTLTVAAATGALVNDRDPDGDTLRVSRYDSQGVNGGTVTMNADGSFSYAPAKMFAGLDTFTYTVSDGLGGVATATVTIEVAAVNQRSVSVEFTTFSVASGVVSGQFTVVNQSSGGYWAQISALTAEAQYRTSAGNQWIDVAVSGCAFQPGVGTVFADRTTIVMSGCKLGAPVPAGATLRVTVMLQVYGQAAKNADRADKWYLARATKTL